MRNDRRSGVVLAMVLILGLLLSTTIITFSSRSITDGLIARNRDQASKAKALARGGIQVAIGLLLENVLADGERAEEGEDESGDTLDADWARIDQTPLVTPDGDTLNIQIRDTGARLNINALVDYSKEDDSGLSEQTDAVEFLRAFLERVLDTANISLGASYDERELAQNLIDYLDPDEVRLGGRGSENDYYQRQSPPYKAANRPILSIAELSLVEGFDEGIVRALSPYLTVYPPVGGQGINLNTAPPHVLTAIYHGTSGDREMASDDVVERILKMRDDGRIICDETNSDPDRCIALGEVLDGSIYPPVSLPSKSRVFVVISEAKVGELYRTLEATIDIGEANNPRVLTWRYR